MRDSRSASAISVVATVRNDREGTEALLIALSAQTRLPDEVVVVVTGSTDGTLELLERWTKGQLPLRVLEREGANISAGRNAAVAAATHEWIACTDAGCRPDSGWLDAIDSARAGADLVTGVAAVGGSTQLERLMAITHYPAVAELRASSASVRLSHRLFGRRYDAESPGGGSMAFRKTLWERVGGFPEQVHAGEDRAFGRAAVDQGFRAVLVPDASVTWRPPTTLAASARMFFTYCRGDIRVKGRRRHAARLTAWSLASVVAARGGWRGVLTVALGGLAYIALPVRRALAAGFPLHALWRVPLLVAVKDLAQIAGAAAGLIDVARGIPQPNPHDSPAAGARRAT